MKTVLLIHGPNLNKLGQRDHTHYGGMTLHRLEDYVSQAASARGINIRAFQSNHEGVLIDIIQEHAPSAHGIIINPGALTHYSYALHDAILDAGIPVVEVHLSDILRRESWRAQSVIAPACVKQISGKGADGYIEAVELL